MNKTALLGLIMALALPLAGYFIVKQYSKDVTPMPRRYIYDTVTTKMVNGKQEVDTQWHRLPDFRLTNQLGQVVTWDSLKTRLSDDDSLSNKVVVIDFFFTHCPTICPRMTENMRRLQDGLSSGQRVGDQQAKFVHLLSLSVDPERDSVAALKRWADRWGIDPDKWWLLTGNKDSIYDLSINHLKVLSVDGKGEDTSFIHSDRMILVD
ncbi:MAG: SCO family protein, partial [Sphingobacteriales bacterium]